LINGIKETGGGKYILLPWSLMGLLNSLANNKTLQKIIFQASSPMYSKSMFWI
jgi:hypothetical protein